MIDLSKVHCVLQATGSSAFGIYTTDSRCDVIYHEHTTTTTTTSWPQNLSQ